MPCQVAVERPREQRLVQASGQFAGGELGAGAREGCLAGHGPGQVPAAQSAQGAIGLQALDRRARSGLVEDDLGDEGARHGGAACEGAAAAALPDGQAVLDLRQFHRLDEAAAALAEGAEFLLEPGEQPLLEREPVRGYGFYQGHIR